MKERQREMAAGPPEEQKDKQQLSPQEARERMERVVDPEHLKALTRSGALFRYEIDPDAPALGYTRLEKGGLRRIFFHPRALEGLSDDAIGGLLYHEGGHHAPDVDALHRRLMRDIGDPRILPEVYRDDPQAAEAFYRGLQRHLYNGLEDVWLESYVSRAPFFGVRDRIQKLYQEIGLTEGGETRDLRTFPKPEQLVQIFVGEHRHGIPDDLAEHVDPDVLKAYQSLARTGALDEIENRKMFESYFASEKDFEQTLDRKYEAYRLAILPEYLKLVEAEVQERMEQKNGGGGGGRTGSGHGAPGGAESTPMTKEEREQYEKEMRETMEELMDELAKLGDQYAPKLEDKERTKEEGNALRRARKDAEARAKGKEVASRGEDEEPSESALDRIHDLIRERAQQREEAERRGLAEALKIPEAHVKAWTEMKQEHKSEINSLAAALSEIFLDNRRKRLEYLKRQGELVPGLEYETISAMMSGDQDPQTRMRYIQDPEFLETEIEFIVDTSGSMGQGGNIQASAAAFVITVEAFRKIREDLEAENLLAGENEQPLRIGVVTFDVGPHRIHPLEKPIGEKDEVKIVSELLSIGGGTSETQTIEEVHKEMALHRENIFKLIVVLSDGYGDKEKVHPILDQIEKDDAVGLFAAGLGGNAEGVRDTYLDYAAARGATNIEGVIAHEPGDALPPLIEFVKRQVRLHSDKFLSGMRQ